MIQHKFESASQYCRLDEEDSDSDSDFTDALDAGDFVITEPISRRPDARPVFDMSSIRRDAAIDETINEIIEKAMIFLFTLSNFEDKCVI